MLPLLLARAFALEPVLDASVSVAEFPLGLLASVNPGVKLPLWNQPDNILFKDTWLRGRLLVDACPAFARVGPEIGFSPIAVLELTANYEISPYFGTFGAVEALPTADAVADDATMSGLPQSTGLTQRMTGTATLQAQVGPVVFAAFGGPQLWLTHSPAEARGDYWWEPETELVMSWTEHVWSGTSVLLYAHTFDEARGRMMYAGAYGEGRRAMSTGDTIVRTGLMGLYAPSRKVAFIALALAQVEHRVYTAPFPPYLAFQARFTPLAR